MNFQTLPTGPIASSVKCKHLTSALDHILDARAHTSRKAAAADLHAAKKDGVNTGARPDTYGSIRAFAASAAGMVYENNVLNMRVNGEVKRRDLRPFPGTDPRHIKGATRKQIAAGMVA